MPELPAGWAWVKVDALGEVQLGRQRSPKNRSKDFPTKYIRAANITENGLALTDVMDMEFKPDDFQRYQLMYGDILLSEASGSPDQVGKPALWRDQIPNCCFQNTVIRLRLLDSLYGEYFLHLFKHFYTNGVFAKTASGVGINHLSAGKFASLSAPLAPVNEQKQIVQEIDLRLSVIDQLEQTITDALQQAEALRQSILKKAFAGQLVPQDPQDEPASVLLSRIRAAKNR
ncbi:MAG: restriction endonuclease subunit S [Chloroflexi bacterium]|nr:restriction endonuclease subunit S [Chloroflexota bacterium]